MMNALEPISIAVKLFLAGTKYLWQWQSFNYDQLFNDKKYCITTRQHIQLGLLKEGGTPSQLVITL